MRIMRFWLVGLICFLQLPVFCMERQKRKANEPSTGVPAAATSAKVPKADAREGKSAVPVELAKQKYAYLVIGHAAGDEDAIILTNDISKTIEQLTKEHIKDEQGIKFKCNFTCIKLELQNAKELFKIAENYYVGSDVKKTNQNIARHLFEVLIDAEDVVQRYDARLYLGQMLLCGHGGAADKHRAWNYFIEITDGKGSEVSQAAGYELLGEMYYYGDGVERDVTYAMECFALAKIPKEAGAKIRAWFYRGIGYYLGIGGLARDINHAYKYFNSAYTQKKDEITKAKAAAILAQIMYLKQTELGTREDGLKMLQWVVGQQDSKAKLLAQFWLDHNKSAQASKKPLTQKQWKEAEATGFAKVADF